MVLGGSHTSVRQDPAMDRRFEPFEANGDTSQQRSSCCRNCSRMYLGAMSTRDWEEKCAQAEDWRSAKAIYDFHALDIDGNDEPGDNAQIKAFAENYGVKFDMYSKIDVNGDDAHPLWKWMKEQPKGRGTLGNAIKWNFTKFLINREGQVVKRYSPMEDPYVIEKDLPAYL
ncbi:glutathione peroxidase 4 [Willisornis vidua]|uniref:phospholipid-hydroperoxide glutathione peroxidase n=1 Tax=Willisornis vidua TaxID=1566151 RepID=A0ABQ9CZI5_9PASS|nr:glutathione peroxidase 4 [Willisornis vidua]